MQYVRQGSRMRDGVRGRTSETDETVRFLSGAPVRGEPQLLDTVACVMYRKDTQR